MQGFHFLREDWRSGEGSEPAWTVGEERTIEGEPILCERGYHYGRDWMSALKYAPGPVACVVEVEDSPTDSDGKGVSLRRKLVAGADCSRELRLFACDCAERSLQREREAGREPDARSWRAVEVARAFARGDATAEDLANAAYAAANAAANAAYAAAYAAYAAANAAYAAYAAANAAYAAEIEWQRQRLHDLLAPRLGIV